MQKTTPAASHPEAAPAQRMPHAPPVLPDAPLPPRPGNVGAAAATHMHPLEAQHERVVAAHAAFLRLQEQVHGDFLASRQRLMESLGHALAQAPAPPGLQEGAAAGQPEVHEAEVPHDEAPVATQVRAVGWNEWYLDSHVAPVGLLLGPVGTIALRGAGIVTCEMDHLARLPGPGDTLVCEVREAAGDGSFRIDAYVNDPSRPATRIVGWVAPGDALVPSPVPGAAEASAHPKGLVWTEKRQFSEADLNALADGGVYACFGKGFERTASHTRTTPLSGTTLARLTSVAALDPSGGPFAAGSLRARLVSMPEDAPPAGEHGLELARIYQGALQTIAFFITASGRTIDRDGWRFEPIEGQPAHLQFAGAPPYDAPLDYELVVERFEAGAAAAVTGRVKAYAGGRLVFQSDDLGLRLVPDFPLSSDLELQAEGEAEARLERPTVEVEGFRIGYKSLLAGALGWPSQAFREPGGFFETGERTMPRLPGPPYHFITRVTHLAGERLTMKPGAEATMEYDVPPDAWYFDESGYRTMPFCVLLEAALQPCGWLSVYVGCPLATTEDVFFRNLDGAKMVIVEDVPPDCTLTTHSKVISVTNIAGVIIISYRIRCTVGDKLICKLDATFGYFPREALASQAGLPMPPELKARLDAASGVRVDFAERQDKYFAGPLRLPGPALLMMDRVTGYFPDGGTAGKGLLRAEKDVKPSEWFFKAHFFSDPVQPGSLGLEMMLQLLKFHSIEQDLAKGIAEPYFEPFALNSPVSWKFRGQVRPSSQHVVTDVEITSIDVQPDQVTIVANGSLWVDGIRCYEAKGMGVRIKSGRHAVARPPAAVDFTVDPAGADKWVADHRPSHTVPVMPMTGMVDRLAGASLAFVRGAYPRLGDAPEWVVVGGDELRAHGWLVCDERKHLRTTVKVIKGRASARLEEVEIGATLHEMGSAEPRKVASGRVRLGRRYPKAPRAWSPLADAKPSPTPYESGAIGHGPALQLIKRIAYGSRGASAELDAAGGTAPVGTLHQALLDGALQAIPHDELDRWSDKIAPNHVGVPVRTTARFFAPPPTTGIVRLELRFVGFDGGSALPTFGIQLIAPDGRVWAALRHVELLVPTGPQTSHRAQRVPFLVEKKYVEGACLSKFFADRSELADADVKRMDWIPGSVAHVYGLVRGAPIDNRVIAVKDYVSNQLKVHPAHVEVRGLQAPHVEMRSVQSVGNPLQSSAATENAGAEKVGAEGAFEGKTLSVTVETRGSDVVVKSA